ncbi:esterase-like activity of phytase family protein [Cribrihabitans neustonicus]|uniref:esterase-like activity of phytase family protein n=1 Tax=Cribrihabitans neustonicus TaxID=1429085 RepID=UPI003B59C505
MRYRPARKLSLALAAAAALAAAVAACAASRPGDPPDQARYLGSYTWKNGSRWFGGLSALEVSGGGTSLTVLSDRAHLASAQVERGAAGAITGVTLTGVHRLRGASGDPLGRGALDSEGLALDPGGGFYVSFEGRARVARYDDEASPAKPLPRPREFRRMPRNKALEALAISPEGHLYTMPERALDKDRQIPVWRWDGRRWSQPFSLPPRDGFLPVGADFGPDGRFYLLERDFAYFGFRSRLRRWDITAQGPENETVLLQTGTGTHDNLEGLAVWRAADGSLRATMISDDNFTALQRTELVEYALPP